MSNPQPLTARQQLWYQNNSLEWPAVWPPKEPNYEAADGDEEDEEEDIPPRPLVHDLRMHSLIYTDEETSRYFTQRPGYGARYTIDRNNPPRPPPKLDASNAWLYSMYIPEWTDPAYVDHGHRRDDDGKVRRSYPLSKDMRPAQRASDALRNPTPHAARFGFYPGRTDGRSRTTPTDELRMTLPGAPWTAPVKGEDVDERFRECARGQNVTAAELLERLTDPEEFDALGDEDKFVVSTYENLQGDRDWQSVRFNDFTTDELKQAGIFEIVDHINVGTELTNEIHPLFARERWGDTHDRGEDPLNAHVMYNVNSGRRGEWNLREDDWLWERMQPMLRLLSKLWEHCITNDAYWDSLLNPFNREEPEPGLDPRNKKRQARLPVRTWTYRTSMDQKPRLHQHARALGESFSGKDITLHVLDRYLRFYCTSATFPSYDDPKFDCHGAAGETRRIVPGSDPNDGFTQIRALIAAEYLFPIIQDGYSASEKAMANFVAASTILHEVAHAAIFAQVFWTSGPGAPNLNLCVPNSREHNMLREFALWLWGTEDGQVTEPNFEREQEREAGFSMEQHLYGGCPWPLAGAASRPLLHHLQAVPAGVAFNPFPSRPANDQEPWRGEGDQDSDPNEENQDADMDEEEQDPELDKKDRDTDADTADSDDDDKPFFLTLPPLPTNQLSRLVPWRRIARFFTEEFWDLDVPRFGSSAFLMMPDPDSKFFNLSKHSKWRTNWEGALYDDEAFSRDEHRLIWQAVKRKDGHLDFVKNFLETLLIERYEVQDVWHKIAGQLEPIARAYRPTSLIVNEVSIMVSICKWAARQRMMQASLPYDHPTMVQERTRVYDLYTGLVRTRETLMEKDWLGEIENFPLPPIHDRIFDEASFWANMPAYDAHARRTINPLCKRALNLFDDVVAGIEAMVAQTWTLRDQDREWVGAQFTGSHFNMSEARQNMVSMMQDAERLHENIKEANPGVVHELHASAPAMVERLQQADMYLNNLFNPPPPNWADRLSAMPSMVLSRRPGSARWLAMAKKEISLLRLEDAERIDRVLELLQKASSPEHWDLIAGIRQEQKTDSDLGFLDPFAQQTQPTTTSAGQPLLGSGLPGLGPSQKRRHPDDDPRSAKRLRFGEKLGARELPRQVDMPDATAWAHRPAIGQLHISPFQPAHFAIPGDSKRHEWSGRLEFPRQGESEDRGSPFVTNVRTPTPGTPPPWETGSRSFPAPPPYGVSVLDGRVPGRERREMTPSMGIFPHPDALAASTTEDIELGLQHELAPVWPNFMSAAFRQSSAIPALVPSEGATQAEPIVQPRDVMEGPGTPELASPQTPPVQVELAPDDDDKVIPESSDPAAAAKVVIVGLDDWYENGYV